MDPISEQSPPEAEHTKIEPKAHKKYQEFLDTRIIGQPEATEAFAHLAVRIKSGIRKSSGIIDSKFLAGPSGVGKTEITLSLARLFDANDGPPKVIKVDCGLLQQPHEMSKLVGSPPGYVGSEGSEGYIEPVLSPTNIARNTIEYKDAQGKAKRLVIIIFDEFEKAHPDLQKLLLVSLDKGTIQTASNKNVDLSNAVILFTSNIGNKKVEEKGQEGTDQNYSDVKETITSEMKSVFPPEFRGRVNDVIVFRHLTREANKNIARIKLAEVKDDFFRNEINIDLSPSEQLLDYLAEKGDNRSEGARAIIKLINDGIYQNLIAAHADFNINGREIILDIDENGKLAMYFGGKAQERESYSETTQSDNSEKTPLVPEKPIEEVQARLIASLKTELEELGETMSNEEGSEQLPIVRCLEKIDYIYDLSEKVPELREYLRRRSSGISLGWKTGLSSLLTTPDGPLIYYRLFTVRGNGDTPEIPMWGETFRFPLIKRPDRHLLLAQLTDHWDRGDKSNIEKIGGLTKQKIIQDILREVSKE